MNPKMISQEPITMAEVKATLDKSKKASELNYRAQKTHDYLMHNTLADPKKVKEIYEKIEELNVLRLKENHIIKIIDTMPGSVEEIKSILTAYPISVTNENLKKIIDVLDDYRKL